MSLCALPVSTFISGPHSYTYVRVCLWHVNVLLIVVLCAVVWALSQAGADLSSSVSRVETFSDNCSQSWCDQIHTISIRV